MFTVGFNINIIECKFKKRSQQKGFTKVLI